MHYVKHFNINGVDTKQVACIELHGKPNAATEGAVGVMAIDVDSPLRDIYKCVAVNGNIYTWDLLSSGLSVMSATTSGEGAETANFEYDDLVTPEAYVVKHGDLIIDADGYLYVVDTIDTTYCTAKYCNTHLGSVGEKGDDGVGIDSIYYPVTSTEDGGENITTIRLTNGSEYDIVVRNGSKGSTGEQGEKGDTGTDGVGIASVEHTITSSEDDGRNIITVTLTDGTKSTFWVKNGSQGSKGDTGATGAKGDKGDTGEQGIQGEKGDSYVLTDADKQDIADLVETVTFYERPSIVSSVDEMADTSKQYVLESTGTIWEYKSSTVEQDITVTEDIEATDDNGYLDGQRFASASDDTFNSNAPGYHVTPLIDLTKDEYQGKTIQIHLEGGQYSSESAYAAYIQTRVYGTDMTILGIRPFTIADATNTASVAYVCTGISIAYNSATSTTVTITIPPHYGHTTPIEIGYLRFCGKGAVADSNIYITYPDTETVTGYQWTDTGLTYNGTGSGVDEETLAKVSALNNEGEDVETLTLLPSSVLDFYNAEAYPDDDYTTTHLSKVMYPYRADMPVPFTVKWNYNEDAMRTIVAFSPTAVGTGRINNLRMYDATGLNKYPIYNLLPNTTYYYKVTHILSDGSIVEAKSGSFTTSNETIRLIHIDGTQNVRDLGGWTGLDGATVKYGNIFRGAAFSDSSFPELMLTGKGKRALGDLGVQAELNLGATDTETSIASNCSYNKIYYTSYATAITDATYRGYFKTILEWIVDCLTNSKPVYMHCQGGCDRTGTLSFQLLGLLGVSESDLAKEYELSSFSNIGYGRLRTTTKAVDTYDYVGMVEALKEYSGDTITDKFYDFATTGCGISADTITSFRSLMLE